MIVNAGFIPNAKFAAPKLTSSGDWPILLKEDEICKNGAKQTRNEYANFTATQIATVEIPQKSGLMN